MCRVEISQAEGASNDAEQARGAESDSGPNAIVQTRSGIEGSPMDLKAHGPQFVIRCSIGVVFGVKVVNVVMT